VSKDLNTLWKDGKLIKITGRPVTFFDMNALCSAYGVFFLPATIAAGEKLSSYLNPSHHDKKEETEDAIDALVGAKDSMATQVAQAKAAVSYPPNGLATLLYGNVGVGKWKFASIMADYARHHGYKEDSSLCIRIDCTNYRNANSEFDIRLFGVAKNALPIASEHFIKGAIDESNKGIVYLDNIDCLNLIFFDQLTDVLEKNIWSRIGETGPRNLECMIVAGTANPDSKSVQLMMNHFPIHINIPDFNSRNINEKFELILDSFAEEAVKIHYPIRFHRDILSCFAQQDYQKNLTDLHNEVRQVCSKAYLDARNNSQNVVAIGFQHLSISMMSADMTDINRYRVSNVLDLLDSQYILIDENGSSAAINYFHNISARSSYTRMNQFVNEFSTDIAAINNVKDYCVESITCLSNIGNAQLSALQNAINPEIYHLFSDNVFQEKTKDILAHNLNLLYGVLLHITNLVKRAGNSDYTEKQNETIKSAKQNQIAFPEYQDACRIVHAIEERYNTNISSKEIDFIAQYLNVVDNWYGAVSYSILLISHGSHIASSIKEYTEEAHSKINIAAIDYSNGMQFNDLLELAVTRAKELDNGSGVLIISDYEPLLSISDHLRTNEGIKSRTISPLSLPLVLSCINQINSGVSLDQLAQYYAAPSETAHVSSNDYQSNFIRKLTDDYLSNSLTFLNPNKGVDNLVSVLNNICKELNRPVTKELSIKFIYHGVHMLERVISNQPLNYKGLKEFAKKNRKMMHIVEKAFVESEELFGIHIPESEYAFITEIFLFDME